MWLLLMRAPRTPVSSWPGRRLLAALDALAWPALGVLALRAVPFRVGTFGAVLSAAFVAVAIVRCRSALMDNAHYRFTTLRAAWLILALLAVGLAARLMTAP